MNAQEREVVLRKQKFPEGTEVVLEEMKDEFAPPKGTKGRVKNVDDVGTVFAAWETGSGLGAAMGEDVIRYSNPYFLIAGKSGTGKSAISALLEGKYSLAPLQSYTTRAKREGEVDGKSGHWFVSGEEFDQIYESNEIIAYTEFAGHRYCATADQVEESGLYVLDFSGIREFREKYDGEKQPVVIYLYADEETCRKRMIERGDDEASVDARIEHDKEAFTCKALSECAEGLPIVILNSRCMSVEEIAETIMKL